jgi:hypothetical protein
MGTTIAMALFVSLATVCGAAGESSSALPRSTPK